MNTTTCAPEAGPDVRKYYGKYPALVLDPDESDADTSRGEIHVEVPGILEEDPGATGGPSANGGPPPGSAERPIRVVARPCFPTGFYFVPEPGKQVWVEFAAGDINSPLWTGVWYPEDAAPQTVDGEAPAPAQKLIRTPSGQVVQLEDTEDGERLVLTDETNTNRITLDKDGIRIEGADNTITLSADGVKIEDANGNTVEMAGAGVTVTDGNQNTIEMASSGITLQRQTGKVEVAAGSVKATDGTGAPKLVVLAPFLDWVKTHQHTGNMGGPTPPFPADLATLAAQSVQFQSGA